MSKLTPSDLIHGEITRISNSGNGMLDYGDGEISVGPVRPDAVGRSVDAVVYDENTALCLTAEARSEFYDNRMRAQTGQLIDNPPADCPGVGELIDVELSGRNSAGKGNATFCGLPVRIQNVPEGTTAGELLSVKLLRIEPSRLFATAMTELNLRDRLPEIGETFSAPVSDRTQSGNGVVDSFVGHRINLGPVTPDAVGTDVDAVLLDEGFAFCLTDAVVGPGYAEVMDHHITEAVLDRSSALARALGRDSAGDALPGRVVRPVRKRRSGFSRTVREAYDYRCAVCGNRWQDEDGYFEVEAAHIYPVAGADSSDAFEGGPDALQNGMALCRTHHWAFDHGWFGIDDDYCIVVRDEPSRDGYDEMAPYDGERLYLPSDRSAWPARHYLAHHRSRIWNGGE